VYRSMIGLVAVLGLLASSSLAYAQRPESAKPSQQGASLGIAVEPSANELGQEGVVVMQVFPAGPAAKAGVKPGDLITKADEQKVNTLNTLLNVLKAHKPGDKVTLHVKRDGKEKNVSVTLESRTALEEQAEQPERRVQAAFLGVQASPESRNGAVVNDVLPKSPADKAGLRKGDVITRIDDQAINTPRDLIQAVRKAGVGKEVTVAAMRDDKTMELKAKLEAAPADLFGGPPPGILPGGPGQRLGGPQLLELPERVRQLQQQVNDLERRLRALEQKK
jgi:S1-C subfamily serine protease